MKRSVLCTLAGLCALVAVAKTPADLSEAVSRPNILFCIADDWGWPHAGAYGDPVVRTPAFDRIAREGVLFEHAYISSPSCTPSRNAILTGQYHWRLKEGANLWSTLDVSFPVYPLLLARAGYHVGYWRKSWGPGDLRPGGYVDKHPAGRQYSKGFASFLQDRPAGKPFCFWLGASDPHRGYAKGSGAKSGLDLDRIPVPGFFPDVPEVRSDIADYYFEVERFNKDCAAALRLLEERGELDNTIIVMTGDHGMPFPRCKSNLYDMGARVPLAVRWGAECRGGRRVTDFVSLTDLAPTFLEAGGVVIPRDMTGRSLIALLRSGRAGRVETARNHVLFGKERHVPAQAKPSIAGYPCRGIRTDDFLYILNFAPDRWPAGVPSGATHPIGSFADCDAGPTKKFIADHANDPAHRRFHDLCFGKRPAEELYYVSKDPDQLKNLAGDPIYDDIRRDLAKRLRAGLRETGDPRVLEGNAPFDDYPYRAKYSLRGGSKKDNKEKKK